MWKDKQLVALAIRGHEYDDTYIIMRHLMFDLNGLSDRQKIIAQDIADKTGKAPFASYIEQDKEDRKKNLVFSCYRAEFFTDTQHYTMDINNDHKSFIKNIIAENSIIDVALIMIPADDNFMESITCGDSTSCRSYGKSRLYSLLIRLLGIKQIIIGIDKMDSGIAQYKESRYNEIKEKTISMLLEVGWSREFINTSVPFLPISGFIGDNLINKSDNMPWWNGSDVVSSDKVKITVVTLIDALEKMVTIPAPKISSNMRTTISGIYKVKSNIKSNDKVKSKVKNNDKKYYNDVITGRVVQGTINCGENVVFIPTHTTAKACRGKISSIKKQNNYIDRAIAGDYCGFTIEGLSKENMPKFSDIIISEGDNSITGVYSFTCRLKVLETFDKLMIGSCVTIFVRSGRSKAKITAINWKSNSDYNKIPNPFSLKINDTVECIFQLELPLVVDTFKNCETLCRVAIIDEQIIVMLGVIVSVNLR